MRKSIALAALILLGAGCVPASQVPPTPSAAPSTPAATNPSPSVNPTTTLSNPGKLPDDQITGKLVRISTAKGDIVLELYPKTAPLAVSNFIYLTEKGFYNNLTFHRREEGFVIQGGDPKGNGTGGPGYRFADELTDSYRYERGILAMANSGPSTNGSQFFIMLKDTPLPKNYTIFGKVVSGLETVDKIVVGDKMTAVTVEAKK